MMRNVYTAIVILLIAMTSSTIGTALNLHYIEYSDHVETPSIIQASRSEYVIKNSFISRQ